jgi:hypothetical protein
MLQVYTASKLHHAWMWRRLRATWADVDHTAQWVDDFINGRPEGSPEEAISVALAQRIWAICEADVRRSDVVLAYAESDDILRGALIETGMAIAWGKRVICCGDTNNPTWGTWRHHRAVVSVGDLDAAHALLRCWSNRLRRPRHPVELFAEEIAVPGIGEAAQAFIEGRPIPRWINGDRAEG